MKITTTTIECTADELRQSNSLSEAFTNALRNVFNGVPLKDYAEDDGEDEESKNQGLRNNTGSKGHC